MQPRDRYSIKGCSFYLFPSYPPVLVSWIQKWSKGTILYYSPLLPANLLLTTKLPGTYVRRNIQTRSLRNQTIFSLFLFKVYIFFMSFESVLVCMTQRNTSERKEANFGVETMKKSFFAVFAEIKLFFLVFCPSLHFLRETAMHSVDFANTPYSYYYWTTTSNFWSTW